MRVTLALLLLSFAACSVDDGFLETGLFPCEQAQDCGDGWGCQRARPYAASFCAPRCDAKTCTTGICSGDETPLCLESCAIAEDGTPSRCEGEGYSCVRTSLERDQGVCYPVKSCVTGDDCGVDEACLTEQLSANPDDPLDNLYCVPRVTDGACPAGSASGIVGGFGTADVCLPQCSVTDTRCPPGFACLTQLQQLVPYLEDIEGPVCTIGGYGLSCQNDTNCFLGSCLDTGSAEGRICTLTCNEASRLAGGCTNLTSPYELNGLLYRMECDDDAPSADGSGLCVVRYNINFPGCTSEAGSAYECASGLRCLGMRDGGPTFCTKECTVDADCNAGLGGPPLYECGAQFCQFREVP